MNVTMTGPQRITLDRALAGNHSTLVKSEVAAIHGLRPAGVDLIPFRIVDGRVYWGLRADIGNCACCDGSGYSLQHSRTCPSCLGSGRTGAACATSDIEARHFTFFDERRRFEWHP